MVERKLLEAVCARLLAGQRMPAAAYGCCFTEAARLTGRAAATRIGGGSGADVRGLARFVALRETPHQRAQPIGIVDTLRRAVGVVDRAWPTSISYMIKGLVSVDFLPLSRRWNPTRVRRSDDRLRSLPTVASDRRYAGRTERRRRVRPRADCDDKTLQAKARTDRPRSMSPQTLARVPVGLVLQRHLP
jgi:hypothetical protein